MNDISPLALTQRINVIGSSGSGKSTFSQRLSTLLEIEYIEMDTLFWKADWQQSSYDEFFNKLEKNLERESWILDGNYTRTIPIKWEKVKTVVWLDYSFPRTLFQSVKRAIIRAWTQQEIWPGTGNRESFKKSFFTKDSIILWSIKNYWKVKEKYKSMMFDKELDHIEFIRLRNPKESRDYLSSLENRLKIR